MPESVEYFGKSVFWGSELPIETINYDCNIPTVEQESLIEGMFKGLTSLKTVNIGENVTQIPGYAFWSTPSLHDIYFYPVNPPVLPEDAIEPVTGSSMLKLNVPTQLLQEYRSQPVYAQQIIEPFDVKAEKVTSDPMQSDLMTGQTANLTIDIRPLSTTDKTLKWESANPGIATVSQNGVITAVNAGNTVVYASTTDGSELKAGCNVTVTERSGLKDTPYDAEPYIIVKNRDIYINGIPDGAEIRLYTITGQLIAKSTSHAISVYGPGLYILSAPSGQYKISVR